MYCCMLELILRKKKATESKKRNKISVESYHDTLTASG